MQVVIGLDPGKKGGVVVLDMKGRAVEWCAADHPEDGWCINKTYMPTILAHWLTDIRDHYDVVMVVIERQQQRPMEGRAGILTTGFGWGMLVGICAGLGIPFTQVAAHVWTKKVLGTQVKVKGADKKARGIEVAMARIPTLELTWQGRRKPHDGLSDAGCIALYALSTLVR